MKRFIFIVVFLFISVPGYSLTILDDDVLFDESTGFYWLRNVSYFREMTYYDILNEIKQLSAESEYTWRLAHYRHEVYAVIDLIRGDYDYEPEHWFYGDSSLVTGLTEIFFINETGIEDFFIEYPEIIYESNPWCIWGGEGADAFGHVSELATLTHPGAWVIGTRDPVPEPSTMLMLSAGLLAFIYRKSRYMRT